MRVTVKPALPGARIWDPAHGRFLAPNGAEVEFDHHWIRHERQGNVTVTRTVTEPVVAAEEAPERPAPKGRAGA